MNHGVGDEQPGAEPSPAAPWSAAVPEDPWGVTPQPPAPPTSPGWTPGWPPAPAAPAPRASRRTAAVAALLLFAAAAGASAGVVALTTSGSRNPSSSSQPIQAVPPGGLFGGGNGAPGGPGGQDGPGPGNGGGSSSGGTGTLDQAVIVARVDPALVDITVSVAGGQGTAQGTGMIITGDGQVLTNNHVIDGASTIRVQIGGKGDSYSATVVGYDVNDDVALLQMHGQPANLTTVTMGDPSGLSVGDPVLALGNALGRGGPPQPAAGTITALDQTVTAADPSGQRETLTGLIETNARIQPGDSGGPLLDSSGNVIGMDTAASAAGGRFRRFGGTTGQGYAIPIDTAMQIVGQIRTGGGGNPNVQVGPRPLLGVGLADGARGATVQNVQAGSPAASAGIVAGDVITSVGGTRVTSVATLRAAIRQHKPGDRVAVTWLDSAGHSHSATVTLISGAPA